MSHVYIRFVTETIDKYSCRRQGVFQAAGELVDINELPAHDLEQLLDNRNWFNRHLARPDRFSRSRRTNAAPKAICWFKNMATEHIRRVRWICRILDEHGAPTEMITSARPGYIVFEDEHQVAAVPFAETAT
jgi:hypothetical protein